MIIRITEDKRIFKWRADCNISSVSMKCLLDESLLQAEHYVHVTLLRFWRSCRAVAEEMGENEIDIRAGYMAFPVYLALEQVGLLKD